jgi:diguanylate cyclase (GGDEF)-like protein
VSHSVYLVDPDTDFVAAATALLGARGLYVEAFAGGREVLERLQVSPAELVISAVQLSDMDGVSLLGEIRGQAPMQEVILACPREAEGGFLLALQAGVTNAVGKPLDEAELMLAVDRGLERATLHRERGRLIDENLEFAREHSLQQRCLELLTHPELEWLQERILAELASICDAQSAALWLTDEQGALRLKAYRGLLSRDGLQERIGLESGLGARLLQGTPWVAGEERSRLLFVPLVGQGEVTGLVQLQDPLSGSFRPEHARAAKTLADFAAVGVRNGRKFLALQRLGLRDRDTAAYNLSYFTDYASKEIYKARRYGRTFALVTFSVDNLPQVRTRLGATEAKKATRGLIRALAKVTRDSDVLAKASDQEFYLLLPETDYFGATMFFRRAAALTREDPEVREVEAKLPVALVGGAAAFPRDGEDFDELVHRCRRRMDERRTSLHRRLMLEPLDFWDEVEVLLGSAQSPRLPTDERAEPARRGKVSESLFEELQEEIARELLRDPFSRGLLYVGGPDLTSELPLAKGLESAPNDFGPRVYAVGRRGDLSSHPAVTPVFIEGDERLSRHEFLLWLGESSAYALLQRRGKGATWGFHTSDTAVVDGLITKLQSSYDLQPY